MAREKRMLDFPSNSVLPPPCGRVKGQEGLNLLAIS